jgi:hypothetical protein
MDERNDHEKRLQASASAQETMLNPPKKLEKRKWNPRDKIIVISQ